MLVADVHGSGAALACKRGGTVSGLAGELTAAQTARLQHCSKTLGWQAHRIFVAGHDVPLTTYLAVGHAAATLWDADVWIERHARLERALAADVMRLIGMIAPEMLAARLGSLRVRAASRLRAQAPAPTTLRLAADDTGVTIAAFRQPYARFFAIEEYDLTVRRFDGRLGPQVTRAVFVTGDAVTVLPYDPVRDRVLLIEQFRAGPMGRGDPSPWQLEAIAGRIDPGETPEEAARREAVEEAGLDLGEFWPVANYYPSPAGKTEFLYSYVAAADLPDGIAGVHGLAEEAEDIKGHVISFDTLMTLVATGEVCNAPVILSALWLERERPRLRQRGRDRLEVQRDPRPVAGG